MLVDFERPQLAPGGEQRLCQLHVDLGNGDLDGFVDDLTQVAVEAVRLAGEPDPDVVRAAIREVLKQRIVARDLCGLTSFCLGISNFNPWQ